MVLECLLYCYRPPHEPLLPSALQQPRVLIVRASPIFPNYSLIGLPDRSLPSGTKDIGNRPSRCVSVVLSEAGLVASEELQFNIADLQVELGLRPTL